METNESRLPLVRRAYFYLVALVSFIVGLVAFDHLLDALMHAWFGGLQDFSYGNDFLREQIARSAGLLIVATPLFLLHWGYAQHRLDDPDERGAGMRKFFLYVAQGVAAFFCFSSLYALIDSLIRSILGTATDGANVGNWLHLGAMVGVSVAFLIYWGGVSRNDGDYGQERGDAAVMRRLFSTALGLIGLGLFTVGTAGIIQALLNRALGSAALQVGTISGAQLAAGLAGLLVGGLMVRGSWRQWSAIIALHPGEGRTGLRRFYLFGAILLGALALLVPATLMLRQILLILFGQGQGDTLDLLADLIEPASYLLPGGLVLWWHTRFLQAEVDRFGQSAESKTMGRIAAYVALGIGLGLMWGGAVALLQALVDRLFTDSTAITAGRVWVDSLATGLSLLAVGAPIWVINWRRVQTVAKRADQAGADERRSGPRRVYLYGVALISALLGLFFIAQILYRLFLLLMGDPQGGLWSSATANEIARGAVAAAIWVLHGLALRGDSRLKSTEPAALPPHQDRAALLAHLIYLEAEVARTRDALTALEAAENPAD